MSPLIGWHMAVMTSPITIAYQWSPNSRCFSTVVPLGLWLGYGGDHPRCNILYMYYSLWESHVWEVGLCYEMRWRGLSLSRVAIVICGRSSQMQYFMYYSLWGSHISSVSLHYEMRWRGISLSHVVIAIALVGPVPQHQRSKVSRGVIKGKHCKPPVCRISCIKGKTPPIGF